MTFSSRQDAGEKLGRHVQQEGIDVHVVLGLPRGGVVVAAQVAKILKCPLEVVLVRKIGHPFNREFAVGALTEHGIVLDEKSAGRADARDVERIVAEERERLARYRQRFRQTDAADVKNKNALIVDDGLATGATAEAAVNEAKILKAAKVFIAVPVASTGAAKRLASVADKVIALVTDPDFMAVGQYYRSFTQTSDEEVLALLHAARKSEGLH